MGLIAQCLPLRGRCHNEVVTEGVYEPKKRDPYPSDCVDRRRAFGGGGYALWKNGFFEKINSVKRCARSSRARHVGRRRVFRAANDDGHYRADSQQHFDDGGRAGAWLLAAMILGVLAVGVGSVIVFLAARALGKKAVQRFLDKGVMDKYLPSSRKSRICFSF